MFAPLPKRARDVKKGNKENINVGKHLRKHPIHNIRLRRYFLTEHQKEVDSKAVALIWPNMGNLYAESGQTVQGSFSAVSKPNFHG